uniref:G-protein coupled receptors family 1 profile domain-containing protein n=1 Tax=Plectus sambesii TaxID=2011161 RepID=A0A914VMT0_9BILA
MLVQVWPFGTWLCRMWLAIDVWMCTASIYNLVAISFDRFMAVTQPLRYKLISSVRMGRLLVALAWIVSFMICLPPLVVPVIMDQLSGDYSDDDVSRSDSATIVEPADNRSLSIREFLSSCSCSPMNNDDIYVIYSAMGSFIVPWAMIIGLNFGIYYTALRSGMAM